MQTVLHLIEHCPRNHHTTGIGNTLQASCYIDTIAVDCAVGAFDHFAQIDTHAKPHSARLRQCLVPICQHSLDLESRTYCSCCGLKYSEDTVTSHVDNAT